VRGGDKGREGRDESTPFLQVEVFKHPVLRKREVGGGWALDKVVGKKNGRGIGGKVIGAGKLCMLFFSGFLIGGSHACIVSVFFDILAFSKY
jgi:hypothetical protein